MTVKTQPLTGELLDFLESLRRDHYYNLGAGQFVDVQNLIFALAARGQLPEDVARLESYIGPLVCNTPAEQEHFGERFKKWVEDMRTRYRLEQPRGSARPSTHVLAADLRKAERRSKRVGWGVAAVSVAAVAAAVVLPRVLGPDETQRPPIPVPPDSLRPVVVVDTPITVPDPGRDTAVVVPRGRDTLGRQAVPAGSTVVAPTLSPVGADPFESLWWAWVLGVGILGIGTYRGFQFLNAKRFLASRLTDETPPLYSLLVEGEEQAYFDRSALFRAAKNFRLHRRIGATYTDIERSVNETVEEGSWLFREVKAQRLTAPEYLVLVDRAAYRDHRASMVDAFVDWLIEHGVFIHRYYFDGDPRVCHPDEKYAPKSARVLSIPELEARYPYRRLLIFSDGSSFFSPFSGDPERWIEQLSAWPQRALLTPEAPANWGWREQKLEATGLLIYPATEGGLDSLVVRPDVAEPWSGRTDETARPLPPSLDEYADRWIEDREPEPEVVDAMLGDVKWYVGGDAGYFWLSACAVYPELLWPLTIRLGRSLVDEAGAQLMTEERLGAITRLPWFRYGRMPGWLREQLIHDMSARQRTRVQAVIDALLESALQNPKDGEVLNVALDHLVPSIGRSVFALVRRREPAESQLHEHVFASFMSRRLAVPIPARVQNYFRTLRPRRVALDRPVARLRVAARLLVLAAFVPWVALVIAPFVEPRRVHEGTVAAVTFSSDGTRLATGSDDGTTKIWDVASGKRLATVGSGPNILHVAFHPVGTLVATSSGSQPETIVWDLSSGEPLLTLPSYGPAAFSPDGAVLALAPVQGVILWDVASGARLRELGGTPGTIRELKFSPDGNLLAAAGTGGSSLWVVASGGQVFTSSVGADRVAFSPDGALLAIAERFGTVTVGARDGGGQLLELEHGQSRVFSLAFSTDGRQLTTAAAGDVRVWDALSGQELQTFAIESNANGAAFNSDRTRFATTTDDETARIRDATTGRVIRTLGMRSRFATWITSLGAVLLYLGAVCLFLLGRTADHRWMQALGVTMAVVAVWTILGEIASPEREPLWRLLGDGLLLAGVAVSGLPVWSTWRGIKTPEFTVRGLVLGRRLILWSLFAVFAPWILALLAVWLGVNGDSAVSAVFVASVSIVGVHFLPFAATLIVLGHALRARRFWILGYLFLFYLVAASVLSLGIVILLSESLWGLPVIVVGGAYLVALLVLPIKWYRDEGAVLAEEDRTSEGTRARLGWPGVVALVRGLVYALLAAISAGIVGRILS